MSIPQQHTCDPTDPEEAFMWALVGLPGPKGAPMLLSPKILRKWSRHLWDLGFRQYPEEQTKEYHPPARGPHHWLNGAGRWVDKGTPKPPRITAPDMAMLTPEERADVVLQLQHTGELRHMADGTQPPAHTETQPRAGHAHVGHAPPPDPEAA